jgi:hypothetical protein
MSSCKLTTSKQVATSPSGTGVFKVLLDSTDCSLLSNSTAAADANSGIVLIDDRKVQQGAVTDWRFYGESLSHILTHLIHLADAQQCRALQVL